jgi:hypothetical protein
MKAYRSSVDLATAVSIFGADFPLKRDIAASHIFFGAAEIHI